MADAVTTYYSWSYPTNGADASTWGTTLNTTIQAIDSQMHLMATLASPTFTGTVSAVSGTFSSTLGVTGIITASAGIQSNNQISISGATGTNRLLVFLTGSSLTRWDVRANATAESGSNAGSDFVIYRYNDAGTAIDNPLTIVRSTGLVQINTLTVSGTLTGTLTGNITGSSASCTGNAATATTATNQSGGSVNATTGAFSGLVSMPAGASMNPAATPATNAVGYLGTPLNEQDASYTFVMADAGKLVKCNSASALTYTIPPSASVPFPIGTVIVIRNIGAGTLTIALGSGITLYKAGSGSQASAAISQYGLASLLFEGGNWLISGINVT